MLVGLRDRAGRRDPRPAGLPQRRRPDRDRARAARSCSTSARRSRSSTAGCSAARATARGRSTSTCCCSATSSSRRERLTLPHREVSSRRFVLVPLLELDPELALPDGTRLSEALERLEGERVEPRSGTLRPPRSPAAARARRRAGSAARRPGSRARPASRARRRAAGDRRRAGPASVISRRRLVAICRSAAFGCSPPSTPSAIQSSIRCSIPGSAARSARDVLVGGLVETHRERDDRAAVLTASPIGTPSRAPSE